MSVPARGGPRSLAEEDKALAFAWVAAARAAFAKNDELLRAALQTNFAWREVRDERAHLAHIEDALRSIDKVLSMSRHYFAEVSMERATEIFAPGAVPPAYTLLGERIYFTPEFKPWDGAEGFGPLCRTAMIVHESVHIFDKRSGEADIHISEWSELFDTRSALQQLHNPSAYASFTAQIYEKRMQWPREARHGAGNRAL